MKLKDKDCQTMDKLTPIHYFIQNNIIKKENFVQEPFDSSMEKTNFEKQISVIIKF